MRKVKRFAAIVLTVALLSPTTAYAGNVEDAKALYEQVTEKQKSVTDMNAYYDYQIHLSGSALEGVEDLSNMRLEMNVRMNHLTDMGNLQYSSYSRATVPGQEPMISTMYYKDGTCYMETAGTKIKYPMDLTQTSYSTVPSVDIELGDKASDHSQSTLNQLGDGLVAGVKAYFGQ